MFFPKHFLSCIFKFQSPTQICVGGKLIMQRPIYILCLSREPGCILILFLTHLLLIAPVVCSHQICQASLSLGSSLVVCFEKPGGSKNQMKLKTTKCGLRAGLHGNRLTAFKTRVHAQTPNLLHQNL